MLLTQALALALAALPAMSLSIPNVRAPGPAQPAGVYTQTTRDEVIRRSQRGPRPRAQTSQTAGTCSSTYSASATPYATFSNANWMSSGGTQYAAGTSQAACEAVCQGLGSSACGVVSYSGSQCVYSPGFQSSGVSNGGVQVSFAGYTCSSADSAITGATSHTCQTDYCTSS